MRTLELGYNEGYYRTISDYGEDAMYLLDGFTLETDTVSSDFADYAKQIVDMAEINDLLIKKANQKESKYQNITHREREILFYQFL